MLRMWESQTNQYVFIFFLLVLLATAACSSSSGTGCEEHERDALLKFKKSFTKSTNLSSWISEDCCTWDGVSCDNSSGHVIRLDLGALDGVTREPLKGNYLDDSLLKLEHLEHLDLSDNDFGGSLIPKFIGSMKQLTFLDLSGAGFSGSVPSELGNLHNLVYLDLSSNAFTEIEGGIWGILQNMCSLETMYLMKNKLHGELFSRLYKDSSGCAHFKLQLFDLSDNLFISGQIPDWLGEEFRSLQALALRGNNFSGQIPKSLGLLSELIKLDLSQNNLSGEVPLALGQLSNLMSLDISSNFFEGSILSAAHFANLSSLGYLTVGNTFLTLDFPSDWIPPFQLETLDMSSSKINGPFPQWLQTQTECEEWLLSNANITGTLPTWFQTMVGLYLIDLSNNFLSGPLPIDDGNAMNLQSIDLSNNFISGHLPKDIAEKLPNLDTLVLSNNQIRGSIPESVCHFASLNILDLRMNQLSGSIPDCWNDNSSLLLINLSHNKLSGAIPCSFGQISSLGYLHLNKNNLSGPIPSCLSGCKSLHILDLGENRHSGWIPTSFNGDNFPELLILRLRDNKLDSSIPQQLCSLPNLLVMDLAYNNFTGIIPRCLNNLTGMAFPKNISSSYRRVELDSDNGVQAVIQGMERTYTATLLYLVNIDLSSNNLWGSIPDELTHLPGLLGLNLSSNRLTGTIPKDIEGLKSLVSLDLSQNKLWGTIPGSMGSLYSLAHLNLSYNNFSGHIPTGNQLQTLNDPSMYAGNPYLCGDPGCDVRLRYWILVCHWDSLAQKEVETILFQVRRRCL